MTPAEYAALNGYQQQQQEENGNLLDFLGKAALAAGAAVGGYKGIQYLRGRGAQVPPKRQFTRPQPQGFEAVRRVAAEGAQANPLVTESALPPTPLTGSERVTQGIELVRQARAERPQGIQLVNLPEARTVFDPWSGRQTIPDPFGVGTVPPAQPISRSTSIQSLPVGRATAEELQARQRLLEDTNLLKRVEAEELAIENLSPENRAQQATQRGQLRRVINVEGEQLLSELQRQKSQVPTQNFLQTQLEQSGYIETSVQRQNAKLSAVANQSLNAVNSGEDQQTGRTKHRLQQNEDLDMSQVELLEEMAERSFIEGMEQDEPINKIAFQLPDGRPLDQAEGLDLRTGERFAIPQNNREFAPRSVLGTTGLVPGQKILSEQKPQSVIGTSASRFMEAERDKILRELDINEVPGISPARVDAEFAKRLGPRAYTYGPKYTARRQALELYAQTGDPKLLETIKRFGLSPVTFETFENMPVEKRRLFEMSSPMSLEGYPSEELQTVIPMSGTEINVPSAGRVDISTIRKPVITENTALAAEEYVQGKKEKALNWLAGIKDEVQPQLNEIFSERRALIENQATQLKPLLQQAEAMGDKGKAQELKGQLNALRYQFRNPQSHPHRREESNLLEARLRGAERTIQADMQTYERKYPTTLKDWSGGTNRVFGELDVDTGEFIPETMELRADRRAVDISQKGGGGRNIAEFTSGERLDEEIRAIQGGGRIRDYDPETGAAVAPWTGDRTQTGREIDEYGMRLTSQKGADPEIRPSVPRYTQDEIEAEAMRLAQADPYGDVPVAPEYSQVVESLGTQARKPQSRQYAETSENVLRIQRTAPPDKVQFLVNQYLKSLRPL